MTKKVAIYTRVSTLDQTIDNQLIELRDHCSRMGWEIVKEYADEGLRYLRGSGGEKTLTAGKRKRVQAALRRYQRRVSDLAQADTQTRGVNRRTLEAFSNYDKRFGPRLSTEEGG